MIPTPRPSSLEWTKQLALWIPNLLTELFPSSVQLGVAQAGEASGGGWGGGGGWSLEHLRPYCGRCGQTTSPDIDPHDPCPACQGHKVPWDRFVRIDRYSEPVRDWILAMKYRRDWSWAPWFGRVLADKIATIDADPARVVVCPVPMHWRRRVRRGYNQAQLMADALAQRRGWVSAPLLYRSRYTPPQASLSRTKRIENVRHSIRARRVDLSGYHVWIVDDVKTTGTTLTRCSRLIRRAGARSVNVAVTAVAEAGREPMPG